ncbi:MAG: VCBS domain-containing protein [Alphaproteobacteria bacterium]
MSDSGLLNFDDVDLIDTHTLSTAPQSGDYIGTFEAVINDDSTGTGAGDISWDFNVSDSLLDSLAEGEQLVQSYDITIDDGHGGTAMETVSITLTGALDSTRPWEGEDNFGVEVNKKGHEQAISNIVLYLQDGDDITKVKIDNWDGGESDLDNVDLGNFLDAFFADDELLAVSIKSGNNHNRDLGPGEGQFYLLDGDPDIDYEQGGTIPEPFTEDILSAHADVTYQYNTELFS